MLILVPMRMITIMPKRCGAFVFGLRNDIKYKKPIIFDIWVSVSMISFMLDQVEHETHFFCLIGWVLCAVLWEASSFALLLV